MHFMDAMHGRPSECGTVLSTDDDLMLSGTYNITKDSNPHSDHNENLKSYIFFSVEELNKLPKL